MNKCKMQKKTQRAMNRLISISVLLLAAAAVNAAEPPQAPDYQPPMLDPSVYLIRDPAVRQRINLTDEQAAIIKKLCDDLDQDLFALRDAPPRPTDPASLRHVQAVQKQMKILPNILTPFQQQHLQELAFQYEGAMALFRPGPIARLKIGPDQQSKMQRFYRQSVRLQEGLRKTIKEDARQLAQETQQIQFQLAQQLLKVLNQPQLAQWQEMLGQPFDFSRTQNLSFRAPDLRNVTAWINTKPLSLEALRGRVVIVHFWTFACGNCQQNYPIYKMWTRQYDPQQVLVLGIHTPESETEKDINTVRQKAEQEGLTFPIAVDNSKANWQAWTNRVWPSVYLVDKYGRVRYWWYGELRWQGAGGDEWIAQRIEELKAEPYPLPQPRAQNPAVPKR